ncbi:hypothetical protein PHYPSEUDO_015011 [Phytophthora pseudosyringae]|uniref:Uncharacterized protein n=1 Tax=Phytophthora pseudosyringae TaxID=221518 RepID=A0A8T1WKX4_9STRA|nr:hypothetical protein PHYPSEUDO_015011 [Phytophthora pseudosyringae]
MQFRAAAHEEVEAKNRRVPFHKEWTDNNDTERPVGAEAEWHVRPGELRSIRQLQQLKTHQQADLQHPANQGQVKSVSPTKKLKTALDLAPEPINYLKLRRTEQSMRASVRNRGAITSVLAQEILAPAAAPPPRVTSTLPRQEFRMPCPSPPKRSGLDVPALVLKLEEQPKGRVDANALDSTLQSLAREQHKMRLEAYQEDTKVHALLADIRASSLASVYKFTPLSKLYVRRRLRSRWRVWRKYVAWHAEDQRRLETLAPFAIHIQRVFRFRSQRWARRRRNLDALYAQWEAARTIQSCARKWLRRREHSLNLTVRHAARLQAAWRGRATRKRVKHDLQTQLRMLLASISPTGNLHRLHEIARGDRALAAKLNSMLILVTETHVAVEVSRGQQRAPKYAAIAARNAARPVKATRRELFHAVHELRQLVDRRERELQAAKERFLDAKRARREQKHEVREETLKKEFAQTTDRLSQARERGLMHRAELETREFVRALRTLKEDVRLRQKLKRRRREQEENALMLIEEYQMRYVVAETQRRELEARNRLMEVSKREQFLQERAQRQLREMEEIMRADAEKKVELERQRSLAREEEKAHWASLSKAAEAEAHERLRRREREEEEVRWRLEAEQDAERAKWREAGRQKEALRRQKYEEVRREQQEKERMGEADKSSRRWHFALKKSAAAEQWEAKREKERVKYSLDPLQFAKMEAQKALEERQRRENNFMRDEDALSRAVDEKERKEQYFKLCRERKRLRESERRREANETSLMQVEDEHDQEVWRVQRQAEEYKRTLEQMQHLADQVANKQKDRLQEARNRKLMYDEENRQRRLQQAQLQLDRMLEKHEREALEEEDKRAQNLDAIEVRLQDKRIREKRNLRMMREDVTTMERQDWEDEGTRLEKLLWSPQEAAALRHMVADYQQFLRLNVEVLMEFVESLKGPPPLDLDYEAVEAHLALESTLTEEKVPPKKRKTRKFFYHEFFEEDPIVERISRRRVPKPEPRTNGPGSTNQSTRDRWKRVAAHFLGRSWGSEASRKGFALMHNGEYKAACKCLLEAVHSMQYTRFEDPSASPTYQDVSPALLRQLGRCLLKQYQACFQWEYLSKSLFFFQQASTHLVVLSNPSFLQEIAFALELNGDYRHAAELLGGIILCFPRYARLMEVIFRAGIVMFSLRMFRQSREYVLHTMEAAPFGWEPFDIVFLAARIMELEGKSSRRLCAVAYEDAYRKSLRGSLHHVYMTWQDWIKAAETWRQLGDQYFERHEHVLAKDAYLMMRKRQTFKPSELTTKRKAVMAALRQQQTQKEVPVSMFDDADWMRLSCTFAMLNDRPTAVTAMSNWLTVGGDGGYRARVTERFYRWPLVRWKLLTGMTVPAKVTQWLRDQRQAKAEAEAQLRLEREAKRQEILRERRGRSYFGMQAWEQQAENVQQSSDQTEQEGTSINSEELAAGDTRPEEDDAIIVTGPAGDNAQVLTDEIT